MTTPSPVEFTSLSAIRTAHLEFLRRFRTEARADDGVSDELGTETGAFLDAVRRAGTMLDREADRREAQSILDAWATRLYRAKRDVGDSTLAEFDINLAPELPDTPSPYLGLDAFSELQFSFFCGRESLVDELVSRIGRAAFLAVIGPSGSGKSSLVYAGLLPRLRQNGLPGSSEWRYYPRVVPGSDPLRSLAQMLGDTSPAEEEARIAAFRADPRALAVALESAGGTKRVITIDQFEELFTLCLRIDDRAVFDSNVEHAVKAGGNVVILTMRDDFSQRLPLLPSLYPWIQANQCVPGAFTAGELREAIEKPAQLVGLKFDDGVVNALVSELIGEPAALPLLQVTLLRLWEKRQRNRVTMETYLAVGGGRRALAKSADEFYESLMREDQELVRRIFGWLVRPGEGEAETSAWRVRRSDLYAIAAPETMDRVLARLVHARLVRLTKPESDTDAQVEIAHEALIRNWDRLIQWTREDRDRHERNKLLESRAAEWERSGRTAGLLDAVSLRTYEDQASGKAAERLSPEAKALLVASREEVRRLDALEKWRRTRLVWIATVAVACALIAIVAGVFLFYQKRETSKAMLIAVEKSQEADRNKKEAETTAKLAVDNQNQAIKNAEQAMGYASTIKSQNEDLKKVTAQAEVKGRLYDASRFSSMAVSNPDRDLSLLLALHAGLITYSTDGSLLDETRAALLGFVTGRHTIFNFTTKALINDAAFSTDGRSIAAAEADGTVQIWDGLTGQERPALRAGDVAFSVAFDLDRSLIVGSKDGARLWDPRLDKSTRIGTEPALRVAFSGDGKMVATAGDTPVVHFWDRSGRQAAPDLTLEATPLAIAFSPDNARFAVILTQRTESTPDPNRSPGSLAPGQKTTSAAPRTVLKTFNTPSFLPQSTSTVLDRLEPTFRVAFGDLGQSIRVRSENGAVQSGTVTPGRTTLSQYLDSQPGLAGSQGSQGQTVSSTRGMRRLADSPDTSRTLFAQGQRLRVETDAEVNADLPMTDISPDRAVFNAAGTVGFAVEGREVEMMDLVSGEQRLSGSGDDIGDRLAVSADGQTAIVSGQGVKVFRVPTDPASVSPKPFVLGKEENYVDVAISADGQRIVGATGQSVVLWDVVGATRTTWSYVANRVAISPRGDVIAASGQDGVVSIRQWNSAQGRQLPGRVAGSVDSLLFDPRGTHLAVSGASGLLVWDITRASTAESLSSEATSYAVFSPSGELIAAIARDQTHVWKVSTKEQTVLDSDTSSFDSTIGLGFSSDSGQLFQMNSIGEVSTTPLLGRAVIELALARVARGWTHQECDEWLKRPDCDGRYETMAAIAEANAKAKQPDREREAVAKYREALSHDPKLPLRPDVQAQRVKSMVESENKIMLVDSLKEESRLFALRGDVAAAVESVKMVLQSDPKADYDVVSNVVGTVRHFAESRDSKSATQLIERLEQDVPSLRLWTGRLWTELCWRGSLLDVESARGAKAACEAAVSRDRAPEARDSRGLNRALLGDYAGAIEDFQAYVQVIRSTPKAQQRQGYIDALRQNRNPFTPEELGKLRASR